MLTNLQKAAAQAIVNVFETGSVRGDYGRVAVIKGDTGHLSYGRSQLTLGSGNLAKLLDGYCRAPGNRYGRHISPYLPRVSQPDLSLDGDAFLKNLLRACADDAVMRDVQDALFEDGYWAPAVRAAARRGLALPLSVAVVYDSFIQGSWGLISGRTTRAVGEPAAAGEKAWVKRYVSERLAWLENHSRSDLRATAYRMHAFQRLIEQDLWQLELPFVVRGTEVSSLTLAAAPRGCYDGPQPGTRAVSLQTPILAGLDVRLMQLGLAKLGYGVLADALFGRGSVIALKAYQTDQSIAATGAADPALVSSLAAPFV
jgi:chitosanase